jgi:hypothetical protein
MDTPNVVKTVVAAVMAAGGAFLLAWEDGVIEPSEWSTILLAGFSVLTGGAALAERSRAENAEGEVLRLRMREVADSPMPEDTETKEAQ